MKIPEDRASDRAMDLAEAWRFIRRSNSAIIADATADAHHPGLEPGDVDTLDQIAASDGAAQMSELAYGLRVDRSTATRAVGRLVAEGLASRTRDSDDARVIRVSLTADGAKIQDDLRQSRLAFMMRVLETFTPEEQQAIGRLIPMLANSIAVELGSEGARNHSGYVADRNGGCKDHAVS